MPQNPPTFQCPHFTIFFKPTKDPGGPACCLRTHQERLWGQTQSERWKTGRKNADVGEDSHETRGGANGIVNTKLSGVLMSVFPTGDKAVKMLLAASRNYVKIWGDLPKSLRHGLCQWNFLAKCHDINTQYSVICRISSPPRSTIFYLNLSLGRGW